MYACLYALRVFRGWLESNGEKLLDAAERSLQLEARVSELEEEVVYSLSQTFYEIASEQDGWYCTNARTTALHAAEELVKMGVFERDATRGHGRVQWFRRIQPKVVNNDDDENQPREDDADAPFTRTVARRDRDA